ncbi:hydroxymethylpyrimidine/phosphomethylpyrimidine kinase [Tenacibaculum amylolyticum]|uniref:hydroxymethylpyrimidine/phosphomethylpyrimidine kinase n=1 Tax=Tenacibaculum amylolyticum TaxID=104269 RepID=UPI003893F2DC
MKQRPYILTIAGFDPSSGAGLTADIKTFEALRCYGLSVCTANTVQNDISFSKCYWTPVEIIKEQIDILFDRFKIDVVKIGIVENWSVLNMILNVIKTKNASCKIVLDPVLKSSTAFDFHEESSKKTFEESFDEILKKIYLITPNYQEIQNLYQDKSIEETIIHIQSKTNLFLKGGHKTEKIGVDELYTQEGKRFALKPKRNSYYEKHGSGCVLSSAIASYIALKYPLLKSCYKGKRYVETILSSNKTLLGYHNY